MRAVGNGGENIPPGEKQTAALNFVLDVLKNLALAYSMRFLCVVVSDQIIVSVRAGKTVAVCL